MSEQKARSAEETLALLEVGLQKRRGYLLRILKGIKEANQEEEKNGAKRGRPKSTYGYSRALRGGMLSEIATITGMLRGFQAGYYHPDTLYNVEDDPKDLY